MTTLTSVSDHSACGEFGDSYEYGEYVESCGSGDFPGDSGLWGICQFWLFLWEFVYVCVLHVGIYVCLHMCSLGVYTYVCEVGGWARFLPEANCVFHLPVNQQIHSVFNSHHHRHFQVREDLLDYL